MHNHQLIKLLLSLTLISSIHSYSYVQCHTYKPSSKENANNNYIQSIQADIRDPANINNIIEGTSSVIFLANAKKKYRYIKTDTEQF
jgi:hypothetical protein